MWNRIFCSRLSSLPSVKKLGLANSVASANIRISRMKLALNASSRMRDSISSTLSSAPSCLRGVSSTSNTSRESHS